MARSMLINSRGTRDNLWFFVETNFFFAINHRGITTQKSGEKFHPADPLSEAWGALWAHRPEAPVLCVSAGPWYKAIQKHVLQWFTATELPSALWTLSFGHDGHIFWQWLPTFYAHVVPQVCLSYLNVHIFSPDFSGNPAPKPDPQKRTRYVNTTSTENNHLFVVQKEKTKPRLLRFC